jgi:hypothetical protein
MSDVFAPPSLEQMRERLDRARSCHRGQVPECRAILLDLRSDIDTALADGSADPALLRLTVDTLRLMADTFKLTTHPADRPVHEHDVVDELYQIVEILPLLPDTEVERATTLQEIYRLRSSAWPYVYIGAPDCARPGGFSAEPLRRAIGLLDGVGERGEELLADCLCDLAERGGIGVSLHERLAAARRAEALMDGAATNRIGDADDAGAERRTRRDGLVGRARQVQGRLFEALGDRDGAIEILLREHARSPLSRADPPRLSRLLREAGRPAEALEVLGPINMEALRESALKTFDEVDEYLRAWSWGAATDDDHPCSSLTPDLSALERPACLIELGHAREALDALVLMVADADMHFLSSSSLAVRVWGLIARACAALGDERGAAVAEDAVRLMKKGWPLDDEDSARFNNAVNALERSGWRRL